MKLNYDAFKEILKDIETNPNRSYELTYLNNEEKIYHLELLIENDFINIAGNPARDSAGMFVCCRCKGLTLQGHKLLESMEHDTLWNKIKPQAVRLGIEGLKQIPGLAIKLLLN